MVTKVIAWNTGGGNITLTYQGQGNGTITVASDSNGLGSARSQVIFIETAGGAVTRNVTITQGTCPVPTGTVLNYSHTGAVQTVTLPPGTYKLQCWGAQGGSNAAASDYDITAQVGGKGGYSEGILTLSQVTTLKIYVGGQGFSSAGGFNGGGNTSGSSTYNSGTEIGVSRMGGGGGATDIRLSDGVLLSRMIVAGGGSGGAMCYKKTATWETVGTYSGRVRYATTGRSDIEFGAAVVQAMIDDTWYLITGVSGIYHVSYYNNGSWYGASDSNMFRATDAMINSSNPEAASFSTTVEYNFNEYVSYTLKKQVYTYSYESQAGYVGGGTTGGGYSDTYKGKQNGAGSNGSFGQGANQSETTIRYCSGAGGGGWYGGGKDASNSDISYTKHSGGGSGFVNIAANASYRPSGYTGLQLDSGSTLDGEQTFEAPAGGTEIGHSGNGYARITRLS